VADVAEGIESREQLLVEEVVFQGSSDVDDDARLSLDPLVDFLVASDGASCV